MERKILEAIKQSNAEIAVSYSINTTCADD